MPHTVHALHFVCLHRISLMPTCHCCLSPRTPSLLQEHRSDPRRSKLKRIVPTVGSFFTPLRLADAFREYDAFFHLSRRKYIPPNFAELRHILNIAQIHASAEALRLITFDADGTLYADGHHIEQVRVVSVCWCVLAGFVAVGLLAGGQKGGLGASTGNGVPAC